MIEIESKKKFMSDIIGDKYQNWQAGDVVFLEAPTGSGKTSLMLNNILPWAVDENYRMLYLVPRAILKWQLENEFIQILASNPLDFDEINSAFDIMTMQGLALMLKSGNYQSLNQYDYIVVDEAHVLLGDSSFNPDMEIVYEMIKKSSRTIRIFISATIEDFKSFVLEDMPNLIYQEGREV